MRTIDAIWDAVRIVVLSSFALAGLDSRPLVYSHSVKHRHHPTRNEMSRKFDRKQRTVQTSLEHVEPDVHEAVFYEYISRPPGICFEASLERSTSTRAHAGCVEDGERCVTEFVINGRQRRKKRGRRRY